MILKDPLVSFIISVYNDRDNISRSIESMLNQSYKNFEILIMNDCSTDDTQDKIDSYSKNTTNIRCFSNNVNLGLTKSLNILIKKSKGLCIARQDSDDFSDSIRLEKQLGYITDKGYDAVTSRALDIQTNKKIPGVTYYLPVKLSMKFKNPFIHGSLLIRKEVLKEIGGYDENYYYAQDYMLFKQLINNNYKIKTLNKTLYKLNTLDNISTKFKAEQKMFADLIKKNKNI
jgi:glycosyltransferase involved in cell wall biosynthesis